jgi:hypothetical protein
MIMKRFAVGLAGAAALFTGAAQAAVVSWTNWESYTVGAPGSALGSLAGGVVVRYAGEVFGNTQINGAGIDYWSPTAPYVGPQISNAPPDKEIITLLGQNPGTAAITNTVTFSTEVLNPYMAIVSQGQPGFAVTYDFDQPFAIIDVDTGYWGGNAGSWTTGAGDALIGQEAHGVIQFSGLVKSISWTVTPAENWHGFTIGVAEVPEPGTWALLSAGLLLIGAMSLRRTRG